MPANWCAPKAKPIYGERVSSRNLSVLKLTLTIGRRGAWSYRRGKKVIRSGCLQPKQMRYLMSQLATADFRPPPQPRIRCAAVPGTFITYFDMRTPKRSAQSSTPCGTQANADVYKLSRQVHSYIGARPPLYVAQPKPIPRPLPRCLQMHSPGPVVYREQSYPLRGRHMGKYKPKYTSTLAVYANGAWIRQDGGAPRRGCLPPATIKRLRMMLRTTQFRKDPRTRVTCRALPTTATKLSSPRKGSFVYRHPCGMPPHPSLVRLRRFVNQHTR